MPRKKKTENITESKLLPGGWWDIRPINNTKADIRIVIGQRSNGKSYGVLRYFLQENKRTDRTFVYVRRWKDDVKPALVQHLFDPLADEIEKIYGVGFSVYYYRSCFYLVDDNGKKVKTIGYVIDISTSHHTKSVPYVDVKYVLLDEFTPMSGTERPLANELEKWENILSTVLRTKSDAVIFLISNTTSKFSPYYVHYGFDINKCEQGTITTKEFPIDDGVLRIALEYCAYSEQIGKKSSKYTTSKMIKSGQWEIPETSDIPTMPNERVTEHLLFSMFDPDANLTIGCFVRKCVWYTIETDENTLLKYSKGHVREFLVLHQIEHRSRYHHLTNEKSLDYNTYNDLEYMLKDILENCDIDVLRELYSGRIFSDNMFTADYFIHCWTYYGMIAPRALL